MLLYQQPVFLLVSARTHAYPPPLPGQFLAGQREFELALAQSLLRITVRHPYAPVPQHHMAGAILMRGNVTFESPIIEWMILNVHGQPFVGGIEARPFRYRPALERAAEFEAEVVVQTAGEMALDEVGPRLSACCSVFVVWFWCLFVFAL